MRSFSLEASYRNVLSLSYLTMSPDTLEYIQASQDPLGLPKLKVGSCFVLKTSGPRPNIPLVRVRTEDEKIVMIQTKPIDLPHGLVQTEEGHYLVVFNSDTDKEIFSIVSRLESEANDRLAEAAVTGIEGLEDKLLRKLSPKGDNLRPTFNDQGKAFLKLAQDCVVFDWQGKERFDDGGAELKRGRYQFLIRCSNIYVGQHGQSNYPASLQFKVAQIRYEALPEPNKAEPKFLFIEEHDQDYTVNNLPSGQKHAAQLGLLSTPVKRKVAKSKLPKLRMPMTDLDAAATPPNTSTVLDTPPNMQRRLDEVSSQFWGAEDERQWVPMYSSTQPPSEGRDPAMWNSFQ